MKYLVVNDEHELYRQMYADLFKHNEYKIEEISRILVPKLLVPFYKLHFNDRINRHFWLPLKEIWNPFYRLHKYDYKTNEQYGLIFLNGSLRLHFNKTYLKKLKKNHPNIKLIMVLYDTVDNLKTPNCLKLMSFFDTVFSFDEFDCKKYGFERIYSTFSQPDFVKRDDTMRSKAFFIGQGGDRLQLLQSVFEKITQNVSGCKFYITDVHNYQIKGIKDVVYNHRMSYKEELQMAFNTECIVEVVRDNQSGVSLRTCEAIAFHKKLLTNNVNILKMPFYNSDTISVFRDADDIDINFLQKNVDNISYGTVDFFSPIHLIERLEQIYRL